MTDEFRSAWGLTKVKILELYKAVASGEVEYKAEDLVGLQAAIDRILRKPRKETKEGAKPQSRNDDATAKVMKNGPSKNTPDEASVVMEPSRHSAHSSWSKPFSKEEQEELNEAYIRCKKGHEKVSVCAVRLAQQLGRTPDFIRFELTPGMRLMHMSREQRAVAAQLSRAMPENASSGYSSALLCARGSAAAPAAEDTVAATTTPTSVPMADSQRQSKISDDVSDDDQRETAHSSSVLLLSAMGLEESAFSRMQMAGFPLFQGPLYALSVAELQSLHTQANSAPTTKSRADYECMVPGTMGGNRIHAVTGSLCGGSNAPNRSNGAAHAPLHGTVSRKRPAEDPLADDSDLQRASKRARVQPGIRKIRYTEAEDAVILQAFKDSAQSGKTRTQVKKDLAAQLGRSSLSIANRFYQVINTCVGANESRAVATAAEPSRSDGDGGDGILAKPDECESLSSFSSATNIPSEGAAHAPGYESSNGNPVNNCEPYMQSAQAPTSGTSKTHAPAGLGMDPSISNRRGMSYTAAEDDAILEAYWAGAQAGTGRTQVAAEAAARLGRDPTGVERRYRELAYYRNAW